MEPLPLRHPTKKTPDRDQKVTRQIKNATSSVDSEAQLIETLLIQDVVSNKNIDTTGTSMERSDFSAKCVQILRFHLLCFYCF